VKGRRFAWALSIALAAGVIAAPAPVTAATGDITEYTIPTASSSLEGITGGPDGNVWFIEHTSNKVGRITPSGAVTEYPIPISGPGNQAQAYNITTGPDLNLWFTEANGIGSWLGRLTPTGTFTMYPLPTSGAATDIVSGPGSSLWFTNSANKIGRMTLLGTFTEFSIPTANSSPGGITNGPDGNIWFTENAANKIGKITPAGVITEYSVPTAGSFTLDITAGPDGNLWFTEYLNHKVGKVNTSGSFTEYSLPITSSQPNSITAGPDGNLWVGDFSANSRVFRVTPGGAITQYGTPTYQAQPYDVTSGPDGNIWFTEFTANHIGKLQVVPLPPLAQVLPAMANAAYGGYTTVTQIQNIGAATANVAIRYFDSTGAAVGSGDEATLPVNATWTVRQDNGHGFAAGGAGSALIYSTQPVASFVNEFAPVASDDATSYTGIDRTAGTGTTLYAPTIVNGAYGGYTTGIGLVNVSAASTDVAVTYRDGAGTVVKTQNLLGVPAGAYQGLYSGDANLGLPSGFAGTATIVSSAGAVAAIVNETGPGGQFSSYDAIPAGNTKLLYAPAALSNAYGGYNTGMGVQNTTGTAGTVTVNYYDSSGTAITTTSPIAAYGSLGIYQGTDITTPGAYTAKITSTVAIAAIVNEVAPSTTAAKQSTAYNTFAAGAATAHLALVESAGADGWSTGQGIMNTGSAATTVTVTYFDTATGTTVGSPQSQVVQPNAYWGLYQPAGGLPSGASASAVVTTTGQPVAVICNESNATTFMSYGGQ